ncbi:unnamed protein product [Ectocarpus fasciculatus]
MAELDASPTTSGSGQEEDSLEESIGSVTDDSASIVRACDSDSSSTTTRFGPLVTDNSALSTSPSARSTGARSATTLSRTKRGRKGKVKHGRNKPVDPASRTKEETLHLIKLRDGMISAKHQEVLLLSRQNQGLREGIDSVEKEMGSLHGVIETKYNAVQKHKRESDRLRREIKRLHVEREEHKGQENAMIVAATQNSRLLKLLEQEELKRESVLTERDEALSEVTELKHRVRTSDEQHAKRTSGLEVKLIKAIGENLALKEKYSTTDEQIETLEKELESVRKQAKFDKETAETGLTTLRQSQYRVISELQESRDELQRTKDQAETKGDELAVCRQQNAELEMRLGTLQSDLNSMERTSSEREAASDEDSRLAQARLEKEISLSESLHNKVASMSRTILRLVERHKDLQAQVVKHEAEEARLGDQIEDARKREVRFQQKVVRLKSSLTLETTHKRLYGALDTFNSQMTKPPLPAAKGGGNLPHAEALAVGPSTQRDKGNALRCRRQLLSNHMALFGLVAGRDDGTSGRHALNELDLSDCGLDDFDVHAVMELACSCPRLEVLNLSMNHIGDAGAASLATVLRRASCGLRRLDLTCNQMSMEGVRVLAKALEENCSRGVSHVYVHSEGRIDALGRKKEGKCQPVKERDRLPDAEQDALGLFFSVVIVDARDNHPQPAGNPDTALPLARRGKRQIGRIPAPRGVIDSKKKGSGIKPERNSDNSLLARQGQVRDFMTKVAYN